MARPDGRAFCALWAQSRRAAPHSGGPRPSRPASASLRPRSGRGPSGGPPARASSQPSPHAARAAWYCWRQGRGEGGSRPRPLGASLPPPAACGPLPLPALGGLGAARPARLRRSGKCGGWSPPAAAQVCAPAGLASRQPLRGGTSPQSKAKPLRGAPAARPCFAPPPRRLRRRCSGPPRPHSWGLWGGAALRPGRAWLRPAAPRWPACGSACAGAALPALGPPGVAAPPRSRRPAA